MPRLFFYCKTLSRALVSLGAFILIMPVLLNAPNSAADIYRWRDKQGHWHFSDSPPSNIVTEQLTSTDGHEENAHEETGYSPPGPATEPAVPSAQHTQPRIGSRAGLFWRITMNDRHPSYLLGTIHSSDPRVTRLNPEVQKALDNAKQFVMEMVMDSNALLQFGTSIMLSGDKDLEQLVGRPLFNRIVEAMNDYGMPETVVRKLKPWAVMAILSMPKPKAGTILDLVLYQRAQSLGIPTSGLESAQEQLAVFEGLSLNDQIELLKMTMDQLPSMPSMLEQLLQAYLADDLGRIETLSRQYKTQRDTQSLKHFMRRLNEERNRRMLQRTLSYVEQGNAFIAVGALHLAGPEGLVALLRGKGYQLEPMEQ